MNLTTGNATYKLINEILIALNNKLIVGGIFCDLVMVWKRLWLWKSWRL